MMMPPFLIQYEEGTDKLVLQPGDSFGAFAVKKKGCIVVEGGEKVCGERKKDAEKEVGDWFRMLG